MTQNAKYYPTLYQGHTESLQTEYLDVYHSTGSLIVIASFDYAGCGSGTWGGSREEGREKQKEKLMLICIITLQVRFLFV